MLAALLDSGLTMGEVLADIPRDPAAIVVYAVLVFSLILVWHGSRGSGGPPGRDRE